MGAAMMRIITTLGGMLFGPVAGFFGTFWVCSLFRPKGDCMWKLDALGYSFVIGVPVGLLTCGGIGFWIGYLADTADLPEGNAASDRRQKGVLLGGHGANVHGDGQEEADSSRQQGA
jgi:hypothetical protein